MLSMLGFSGAAFSQSFSLNTGKESIQLKHPPKNIAVYDLSVLDTLNALNVPAKIVPQTTFQGHLANYNAEQFVKAGTLFEPDLAKLKELKPDLIFVGGRSAKKLASLQPIAPTVLLSADTSHYMADLTQRTQSLAKAFDREKIAQQKLDEIKKLQAKLKAKTQGKSAIMFFAVSDNFMPQAENDRFGFIYELTGFKSVLPLAEKSDAPRPEAGSAEAIKAANLTAEKLKTAVQQQPDYLIVLDRGAVNTQKYASKDNILKHEILSKTDAVKNQKVIYVNADAWYLTGAGLDNTIFMLKELIAAI
ncbi:ABC transporter substrate-binding protein [Acinetobacter lanii]|uniref:ABC transporter substrate-binding protein n=2 Tax=Acinetobacter lanii TaxID=2715163 RepID=A0A6G8S921_9GAMM|nr:ABC transporter substrate-binding protein [Acinetobacter lanii]